MVATRKVKVAVVQAAPALFDRDATVEKACALIGQAAKDGCQLVLLPEAFVPAYPRGLSFGMKVGSRDDTGRRLWERYWNNCIEIPGPETMRLASAARKHGVYVAIGVIERVPSKGVLYCTLVYIGPDGALIGKHRKLKPTGAERLVWGEGDGATMEVHQTALGRIGGLICWENYMPLARTHLYNQGVEIYVAPTADSKDGWQATIRHIALEGRCFVLSCNQYVTKEMYPADLPGIEELAGQPDVMCRGGSAIVSPMGDMIGGPLYDAEGIVTAELELSEIVRSRLDFDVTGHYARPDIFQLSVNVRPMPGVVYHELESKGDSPGDKP